jgi:N-acetylmuramic acid 6-phosphate etherase
LGGVLLSRLLLNSPEDLVGWVQQSSKDQIAAVALTVLHAADTGDSLARRICQSSAEELARDVAACASRLVGRRARVEFVLAGGLVKDDNCFSKALRRALVRHHPRCIVGRLNRESAWGAVELARDFARTWATQNLAIVPQVGNGSPPPREAPALRRLADSPTERRNRKSMQLDRMPLPEAIDLLLGEESRVSRAVAREKKNITRAIRAVAASLRRGGRLLYVGAGTSGRLGVLDASECPPTFGTAPAQVQSIIAGGPAALSSSIEGAEDDDVGGGNAIVFRHVGSRDVVVGIAASGRTPFVLGALRAAQQRRATTVLICFNPAARTGRVPASIVIAPDVGPEVLTGSTRLKCGTATKLILNTITTLAMVRLGKVVSNLMVDLNPSNTKLRDRATRIVSALTQADLHQAQHALERSHWVVKEAIRKLRARPRNVARQRATRR